LGLTAFLVCTHVHASPPPTSPPPSRGPSPADPGLEIELDASRAPAGSSAANGKAGLNADVVTAPSAWTPLRSQAALASDIASRGADDPLQRYLSWPTVVPPSPFERLMIRLRAGLVLYEGADPRTGRPSAVRFYPSASLSFLRFDF